ncbi:MAG: IS3 family transposase [Candidatus Cloacimonadaceae bacterium]|nr:IS3 family transposase [Candidatus Cloacimonadaceae bacterium]
MGIKGALGVICKAFGYSRQAYYKRLNREDQRLRYEEMIIAKVLFIRQKQPFVGVRKLRLMLAKEPEFDGQPVARDALFDLLRAHKLLGGRRKRHVHTTDSKHQLKVFPNLIENLDITGHNQVWVSDMTYIATLKGFCYLSLVTDYRSRKILGYNVSASMEAIHTLQAMKMAYSNGNPSEGLIHHSDKGSQYCSKIYLDFHQKHGIIGSMTGKNHCYDNAVAERVNGILKQEFGLDGVMRDIATVKKMVREAVTTYNSLRLHQSLNYQTPDDVYAGKDCTHVA